MKIERITLRSYPEYIDRISDFIYASGAYGCKVPYFKRTEANEKARGLKSYLEDGSAYVYIAKNGDDAIGLLWGYPYKSGDNKEGEIYVSIIYVDPETRGLHVGTKLLEKIEGDAKRDGFSSIWLHTGGDNLSAQAFYSKRGFAAERIQYRKEI